MNLILIVGSLTKGLYNRRVGKLRRVFNCLDKSKSIEIKR